MIDLMVKCFQFCHKLNFWNIILVAGGKLFYWQSEKLIFSREVGIQFFEAFRTNAVAEFSF